MTAATGDQLWAWQCQEPDGRWSMIAAGMPGEPSLGFMPMIHRDRAIMQRLKSIAKTHARGMGQPLRLARFELAEVEE